MLIVVGTPDGPVICGLARAASGDIKACAAAVAPAARRRIHTFIATSDIHLEHKLRKSRAEVLSITREMVAYARSLVDDVELSDGRPRKGLKYARRTCRAITSSSREAFPARSPMPLIVHSS